MKTSGFALGFQHFPRDLANVNEWKIMFDPSTKSYLILSVSCVRNNDLQSIQTETKTLHNNLSTFKGELFKLTGFLDLYVFKSVN